MSKKPTPKRTKKKSTVKDPKTETIIAQAALLKEYISEQGSSQLTTLQIKELQMSLSQLDANKKTGKVTAARVKSLLEIAKRCWKRKVEPAKNYNFDEPQGKYSKVCR